MSGFLLDTNVISELTRPVPNENVLVFLGEARDLWVSAVTMHELAFGIGWLPEGRRRSAIAETIAAFAATYGHRIIPLLRGRLQVQVLPGSPLIIYFSIF